MAVVALVGLFFLYLNVIVYRRNAYISRHINTDIPRNIDRLIIGDYCDPSFLTKDIKSVCRLSPTRQSDQSIVLVSKRLFSLLNEKTGILTIVQKERNYKANTKGISVYDIPYLHENTIADLGLSWMRYPSRLPLLFGLSGGLKLLLQIKGSSNLTKTNCPINEIVSFCKSRNIKIEYYIIYE